MKTFTGVKKKYCQCIRNKFVQLLRRSTSTFLAFISLRFKQSSIFKEGPLPHSSCPDSASLDVNSCPVKNVSLMLESNFLDKRNPINDFYRLTIWSK